MFRYRSYILQITEKDFIYYELGGTEKYAAMNYLNVVKHAFSSSEVT
jgi:hypothetical protein